MVGELNTKPHAWDAPAPGLRLVMLGSGAPVAFHLPDHGELVLGRDARCAIVIDHVSVSREHARFVVTTGSVTVEDLGSRNGVRIGSRTLTTGERVPIKLNELVEIGAVAFVLKGKSRAEASPQVSAIGAAMMNAYALADLVAPSPVSVVLLGETGVGKTVAAERIHRASGRPGPLLKLNCAAIPEALLEGELFGHERGAFTGAHAAKAGLIESAHGGTLLLDEIGDMTISTQAKLLHVVENDEVTRLGARAPTRVDVRFLAATHRDLPAMVAASTFRADLYYRINGITITIPPLRERPEEVVALAEKFLAATCARTGSSPPALAADARLALLAYRWPGNLRELRNVMERAAVIARDCAVTATMLGLSPGGAESPPIASQPETPSSPPRNHADLRTELDGFEKERIVRALEECGGNQTRAAQLVGLPLRTFVKRLTHHGLTRPRKPGAR